MRSNNKTVFQKGSKLLAEFGKVFNFEQFLIYALLNFNLNFKLNGCYLYFLIENSTQNVYNRRIFNVNNEFNVTAVTNYTFSLIFHNKLISAAYYRLLTVLLYILERIMISM